MLTDPAAESDDDDNDDDDDDDDGDGSGDVGDDVAVTWSVVTSASLATVELAFLVGALFDVVAGLACGVGVAETAPKAKLFSPLTAQKPVDVEAALASLQYLPGDELSGHS